MYYLTEKDRRACEYFGSLETFTEEQAENAIRFCCSVCGCNREEQEHLLNWFFDGVWADLVKFGNKAGDFWRILNFCGDAWIVTPDDPLYDDYRECMFDGCQIAGEILPTCNLFIYNI